MNYSARMIIFAQNKSEVEPITVGLDLLVESAELGRLKLINLA